MWVRQYLNCTSVLFENRLGLIDISNTEIISAEKPNILHKEEGLKFN